MIASACRRSDGRRDRETGNMIGILVVTHGELGSQVIKTARLIGLNSEESVAAVGITAGAAQDSLREDLQKAIKDVDTGEGVLILTDLFGGTPTNLSLSFLKEDRVEIVTGVNLPMVVRAINCRKETDLASLSKMVSEAGRESIYLAGELLREKLDRKSEADKKSPDECR